MDHDFWTEIIARMPDDEQIEIELTYMISQLNRQLAAMTMNDNYRPYVTVQIYPQLLADP